MYKSHSKLEPKTRPIFVSFSQFLCNFLLFENAMTSNDDLQRSWHSQKAKICAKSRGTAKKRPCMAILHNKRRLDFINRVSHGRRSRICSIFAYWGCPDLRGHHGMARRMPVSYSGPREDVSLKALGGYAPSALQTDILPRSSRSRRQLQYLCLLCSQFWALGSCTFILELQWVSCSLSWMVHTRFLSLLPWPTPCWDPCGFFKGSNQ